MVINFLFCSNLAEHYIFFDEISVCYSSYQQVEKRSSRMFKFVINADMWLN